MGKSTQILQRTGGDNPFDLKSIARKALAFMLLCALGTGISFAAAPTVIIVSGTITDSTGEPVAGATILEKDSRHNGVTSNVRGFYRIATKPESSLVYSFVGMQSQTIAIGSRLKIDVQLVSDTDMEEVVVTGYQTIAKHQVAGSVKQVKMEDIKLGATFSVDQMLAGQISGVNVMINSGEPSATPKIRIRGTSSILGNKAPIWVLDGIILNDPVSVNYQDLTGDDAAYLIGNAIAGVNPSDVATITVLKDASATALYGVKAANGVIVVTTKRGAEGKTRIRYDGSFTVNERPSYSRMDLMNASERITLSQEMLADHFIYTQIPSDIGYESLYFKYLQHGLTHDQFSNEVRKMANRNTDWYDLLFRDSFSHNHTLSMSGGTKNTNYYASVGYNNTPTTAKNGSGERLSANLKLNSWITKNLYVGINLIGSVNKNKGYSTMAGVSPNVYAQETARTIPCYNDDGSLFFYQTTQGGAEGSRKQETMYENMLDEMNKTGGKSQVSNINMQMQIKYNIVKGLSYEFMGSYIHNASKTFDWAMESSNYATRLRGWNLGSLAFEDNREEWTKKSPNPVGGILSADYNTRETYTLRNSLQYNNTFHEDHTISVMAISEISSMPTRGSKQLWYGWQPDRGLTVNPIMTDEYVSQLKTGRFNPILTDNAMHYVSWLGNASYSYKDKWTAVANIRMDGSNSFGDNPKYRFLPVWSVAGKYTMSQEPWLKDNKILTYLAFRASYGVQGNVDSRTSPNLIIKVNPTNNTTGLDESTVSLLPNADLRWEKTKSYNLGLDFGLFEDILTGTIDFYRKNGTDMILGTQVSAVTGRPTVNINSGEVNNTGVEVALNVHPIATKNWDLHIGLNYSYNKNKLIRANESVVYSNTQKISGTALMVGKPIGTLYSYNFAHLDPNTGYPVFYDKYGNTTTEVEKKGENEGDLVTKQTAQNYSLYDSEIEVVESGVRTPPHTGGFDLTLRWKNWRLSGGFLFSLGAVGRLPNIFNQSTKAYHANNNLRKEFIHRWKQSGDEKRTNIPVLFNYNTYSEFVKRPYNLITKETAIDGNVMYDASTARIVSTDVLRMRNLSLGYTVPMKFLKKIGIESAFFQLQATNLFFIANDAWGGMDPESGYASVPLPRTYTLNIGLVF